MYNSTVPNNKLQSRLHGIAHEALTPSTGVRHTAIGVLVEVYDQEKLATIALPARLQEELDTAPGLLFAKVRLINGREFVLPFKEPEDQIYLTYGNALQLEGRNVKVEYEGMSIENGQIIMQRTYDAKQVNLSTVTYAYDMGHII